MIEKSIKDEKQLQEKKKKEEDLKQAKALEESKRKEQEQNAAAKAQADKEQVERDNKAAALKKAQDAAKAAEKVCFKIAVSYHILLLSKSSHVAKVSSVLSGRSARSQQVSRSSEEIPRSNQANVSAKSSVESRCCKIPYEDETHGRTIDQQARHHHAYCKFLLMAV